MKPLTMKDFENPDIRGRNVFAYLKEGTHKHKVSGMAGWLWSKGRPPEYIVQFDFGVVQITEDNVNQFYLEPAN